jgi:hypothetical protein
MRSVVLGLTATLLMGGAALAQSANPSATNPPSAGSSMAAPGHAAPGNPAPGNPAPGNSMASPATSGNPAASSDRNAASGNDNQAVASTNANAATPAHGHNSFTRGQARSRFAAQGYSHVSGLKLSHGVWRGQGTKDGQTTGVWLDYKGNIGSSQS